MVEEQNEPAQTKATMPAAEGIGKVRLLMSAFGLSLGDIVAASGRTISKSQLHRIVRGQPPSPAEKRAIAFGLSQLVKGRCNSAFLFDQTERSNRNGLDH